MTPSLSETNVTVLAKMPAIGNEQSECQICLLEIMPESQAYAEMPCCGCSVHLICLKQVVTRRECRNHCCFCQQELSKQTKEMALIACNKHGWREKRDELAIMKALHAQVE